MLAERTARAAQLAGLLAIGALALAGCSGAAVPEPLPRGTTDVQLHEGETAQVSLGEWSPGVGDEWGVVAQTDESVLDDVGVVTGSSVFGADVPDPEDGAAFPHAVQVVGAAPGVSTLRVIYCYRATVEENCDQGPRDIDPIEITITVE